MPRFKDLGERVGDDGESVYSVECALAYTLSVMTGKTRQDAMALAAAEVLNLIARQKPAARAKQATLKKSKKGNAGR